MTVQTTTTMVSESLSRAVEIAKGLLITLAKLPVLSKISFDTTEKAFISAKRIQLHYGEYKNILDKNIVATIESLAAYLEEVGEEIVLGELKIGQHGKNDNLNRVSKIFSNLGLSVTYSMGEEHCSSLEELFRCDKLIGKVYFFNMPEAVEINDVVSWFDLIVVANEHIVRTRDYHVFFEGLVEENGKTYIFLGS